MRLDCNWRRILTTFVALALLAAISGCQNVRETTDEPGRPEPKAEEAKKAPSLSRALDCVLATMRNPSAPFHYSYRKQDSLDPEPFVSETDVTTRYIIAQTQHAKEGHKLSATRGDVHGWGLAAITAIGAFPNSLDTDEAAPSMKLVAQEDVGGYTTDKYDFNTADTPERKKLAKLTMLRLKDYDIRGSAWIIRDTECPARFTFDNVMIGADGTTDSTHAEGVMSKNLQFEPIAAQDQAPQK